MTMQTDEFNFIAGLLKQQSGLSLGEDKMYLLESRLQPIARSHGLESVSELVRKLRSTSDANMQHEVVQSMTTNETMFFRDNKPFERFREVILPKLREAGGIRKNLRLWSAACSSGQEPYTLAMCLQEEMTSMAGYSYDILATDLCEKVVNKAKEGVYTQFEVQRGLPIQLLIKYFQQMPENQWRVQDIIKQMVTFKTHNLLGDCGHFGKFDVVYCRNVLIYFDEQTKAEVLKRIASVLNSPGFLVLGSAETVIGISDLFAGVPGEPGIYTLK